MFKFLHAADIHLDSPLRGLERYEGAPVDRIRNSTRRALENLVDLAIEESVAFLLIAGDLYDGDWRDYSTGLFFAAEMSRLGEAGIQVFLIQGNHDAANRMTRWLHLPENVRTLATKQPETVRLEHLGLAVHGQGFANTSVSDNLAQDYPPALSGCFNVGLLHTSAAGYESHESYAPCSIQDLLAKEYDYWALGHVHKRQVLHQQPWVVFSGNIQGRHIRETGAKGCTLVKVEGGRVTEVDFRELDVLRWELCQLDVTGTRSGLDVRDRFASELAALLRQTDGRPLAVRVEIRGSCAAHREIAVEPERWRNELRSIGREVGGGDVWVEKVRYHTQPPGEPEGIPQAGTGGPVGELVELVGELQANVDALTELAETLRDLKRRLPAELREGDSALDFASPAGVSKALDNVREKLVTELLAGGGQ